MARTSLDPTWIGLDLNATRVRAVCGSSKARRRGLPLDGADELPLAISLEGRRPIVGKAALAILRLSPHFVCHNFLAELGDGREWRAGRHSLDAARAFGLICEKLQLACAMSNGIALALPPYLAPATVALVSQLAARARLPVLASITAPLAATLAAYSAARFAGLAIVVDLDDHALCHTAVEVTDEQARIVATRVSPRLSLQRWQRALLDGIAERCVRQSRRDPRDSAAAEQMIYDQLDELVDAYLDGRPFELAIQGAQWFQNLTLPPELTLVCCQKLVRSTLEGVSGLLAECASQSPATILLSHTAGRLPGLLAALQDWLGGTAEPVAEVVATDDFGESLLPGDSLGGSRIDVLPADALAHVAHELAERVQRGLAGRDHLGSVAPLGATAGLGSGPPRLQFLDDDYTLHALPFTLGRQPGCDLVFDSADFPTVSARHCEIVLERRGFLLRDRSRNGTYLNDRPVAQQALLQPGDWIRLGPDGPLLRFLGRAAEEQELGTTA